MFRSTIKLALVSIFSLNFISSLYAADIPLSEKNEYSFRYEIEIKPSEEIKGKELSLWVPYPSEDETQKILESKINSSWPHKITREEKYGNKIIYLKGIPSSSPIKMVFEYRIQRAPYTGLKISSKETNRNIAQHVTPNKLIPLYPLIKQIAEQEAQDKKLPSQKIRAFYDYVIRNMTYDKSGECWGRGDAVWACSSKRGNCTDFHSLFIGLNRSEKIPAIFEIGFPIPSDQKEGEISGYHCWAEAYAEDLKQWIPVDTTEAKKTRKKDDYFGKLPSNRIQFTIGRDIILNPPQQGAPLNYFIYPYAEIDGKEFSAIQKKFYFKKIIL